MIGNSFDLQHSLSVNKKGWKSNSRFATSELGHSFFSEISSNVWHCLEGYKYLLSKIGCQVIVVIAIARFVPLWVWGAVACLGLWTRTVRITYQIPHTHIQLQQLLSHKLTWLAWKTYENHWKSTICFPISKQPLTLASIPNSPRITLPNWCFPERSFFWIQMVGWWFTSLRKDKRN